MAALRINPRNQVIKRRPKWTCLRFIHALWCGACSMWSGWRLPWPQKVFIAFVIFVVVGGSLSSFMGDKSQKGGLSVAEYEAYQANAKRAAADQRQTQMEQEAAQAADDIAHRRIWIGMNVEQALASRGKPETINRTVFARGAYEQWVYGGGLYLYFRNDVLASWQQSSGN